MTKIRNQHIYGTPSEIRRIKEELDWLARNDTELVDEGHLVVYALPRKHKKDKKKKRQRRVQGQRREQKPKTWT